MNDDESKLTTNNKNIIPCNLVTRGLGNRTSKNPAGVQIVLNNDAYFQGGQWGFIEYRPPKKKTNIDHTALYRPNIDRKSSLKSAHLHYLLLSPEIYTF